MRDGTADAACVPLESSVEGSVPLTQDELTHGDPLMITAEVFVPITFDLLVRPGTELTTIGTVGAHPHGHAQVRDWLLANAARRRGGDLRVQRRRGRGGRRRGPGRRRGGTGRRSALRARVRGARHRHGLAMRSPASCCSAGRARRRSRPGNDRTSLVLSVDNRPGSLLAVLTEFAARGINLTRLESRPTRARMGEYVFLVDADGHLADPAIADVIAALIRRSALVRWLGSYPRMDGDNDVPAPHATPGAYGQAAHQVARWQRGEWS